jgi:transcription factor C subunit 7
MDIRTGTASLGEYIRESQGRSQWICLRNGDSSFLSGGEERNWWFDGDIPGDDPEVAALFADREAAATAAEEKAKL